MAVCLKILYKKPNWLMLMQFMEFYRLQGVSRVFIKVFTFVIEQLFHWSPGQVKSDEIPPEIESLLRYYHSIGLAEVLEWRGVPHVCGPGSEYCAEEQIQVEHLSRKPKGRAAH